MARWFRRSGEFRGFRQRVKWRGRRWKRLWGPGWPHAAATGRIAPTRLTEAAMARNFPVLVGALLVLMSCRAFAAEPVRHIGMFVEPFYRAAPDGWPQVGVGKAYNELLASNKPEQKDAHARAVASAKESAYFDDQKNVAAYAYNATRKRNEADVKYCWRS
jgi:hypothetical protein